MPKKQSDFGVKKAGDGLRWVADGIEAGRENLQKVHVPNSAKFPTKKEDWQQGMKWVAQKLLATGKVTGVSLLWLTEYLVRAMNAIMVDNKLLRGLEKFTEENAKKFEKGKDSKTGRKRGESVMSRFSKNNPWVWAYLTYYASLVGLVAGGATVVDNIKDSQQQGESKPKKEIVVEDDKKTQAGTYGDYLERMKSITPLLIADLVAKEGVRMENGMHVVYDDATGKPIKPGDKISGNPTIGFGSTILKDGKSVTRNTKPITTEEAYELARHHIEEGETFLLMYAYDVGLKSVNIDKTNEALGLGSVIYNAGSGLIENPNDSNHKERFSQLRQLYKEYGYALPDSLVVELFEKYPVQNTRSFGKAWIEGKSEKEVGDKLGGFVREGRGLYWRRWLEAGLINGEVTADMLLKCPVNGMYEFFAYMGKDKYAFFTGNANSRKVNYDTYQIFREWLKNPVNAKGQSLSGWKKVEDCLPKDVVDACYSGQCEIGKNPNFVLFDMDFVQQPDENVEVRTYVLGYQDLYSDALSSFKAGDYKSAAEKYENMIAQYPDNALLRNDLAATYNKLGRYDDAITQSREVVRRIGDKSQYAAAQYNAGFAYEQKGDLQKALANYKLSLANGNRKVQQDITRVSNSIKQGKSKVTAFNNAAGMVKKRVPENVNINTVLKAYNGNGLA